MATLKVEALGKALHGLSLLDEVIDACDVPDALARAALRQALRESGVGHMSPSVAELRRALPELRRALEQSIPAAKAYEAAERVDIVLSLRPDTPSSPPTLAELTRQIREANERLSEHTSEAPPARSRRGPR